MIIFFDEDSGTSIPKALRSVGLREVKWLLGVFHQGADDAQWLTQVGRHGWLAFSSNKHMLDVLEERDTIVREHVGIVFLTSGQEHLPKVLRLILTKWEWLAQIDAQVERPFAFYLYPNGRTRRVL